jgi:hypothetical protein
MPTTAWSRASNAIGTYLYRLGGAAVFDAGMYESLEADHAVTRQALTTILLASIAAGSGAGVIFGDRLTTFAAIAILAALAWAAWAMLIQQIGTRVLREPATSATWGQLLRTTGFAAAPGLLQVFASFPGARKPIFAVTTIWMFAAMVTGVRHALDYRSTLRAIAVCALSAALIVAVAVLIGVMATSTVS